MNTTDAAKLEAFTIALIWQHGFAAGEMAIATRLEALEGAWKHVPAPTWEQQVAARAAHPGPAKTVPTYHECITSWDEATT